MTDQPHPERATEAFFGRRKGKHLKSNHHIALAEVLPKLKLDLTKPAPDNFMDLWNCSGKTTRLEIGFGGGTFVTPRKTPNRYMLHWR